MFNSINGFGGQNRQVRQNPDDYAKQYAEENGLSFEDAKAELKAKYGDPQAQNGTSNIGSFGNFGLFGNLGNLGNSGIQNTTNIEKEIASLREEIASLEEKLFGKSESTESVNSSNSTTNTEESKTTEETKTESTKSNRIKEYKDQTLYKYLKNVRGLSDSEIKALSTDEEKEYKKALHNHIGKMNHQYYQSTQG